MVVELAGRLLWVAGRHASPLYGPASFLLPLVAESREWLGTGESSQARGVVTIDYMCANGQPGTFDHLTPACRDDGLPLRAAWVGAGRSSALAMPVCYRPPCFSLFTVGCTGMSYIVHMLGHAMQEKIQMLPAKQ